MLLSSKGCCQHGQHDRHLACRGTERLVGSAFDYGAARRELRNLQAVLSSPPLRHPGTDSCSPSRDRAGLTAGHMHVGGHRALPDAQTSVQLAGIVKNWVCRHMSFNQPLVMCLHRIMQVPDS